jgi:hypothetical protein
MSHLDDLPGVPNNLNAKYTSGKFPNKQNDRMNELYQKCLSEIREGKFPCKVHYSYDVPREVLDRITEKLEQAGYSVCHDTSSVLNHIEIYNHQCY